MRDSEPTSGSKVRIAVELRLDDERVHVEVQRDGHVTSGMFVVRYRDRGDASVWVTLRWYSRAIEPRSRSLERLRNGGRTSAEFDLHGDGSSEGGSLRLVVHVEGGETYEMVVPFEGQPREVVGSTPTRNLVAPSAAPVLITSVREIRELSGPSLEAISIPPSPRPAPKQRFFNAGFFAEQATEALADTAPLVRGSAYRLGVNIGSPWGPGAGDRPFPEDIVAGLFAGNEVLELDVAVTSSGVDIESLPRKLKLPRSGDSAIVFFAARPVRVGWQAIDVDLLYRGNLVQSRRLEVSVASSEGPPLRVAPQRACTTFTRFATLTAASLKKVDSTPRRGLTIVADRDPADGHIGLRFYTIEGADLGRRDTRIGTESLKGLLARARGALLAAMDAYRGGIGGSAEQLRRALGPLAQAGRSLYLALVGGVTEEGAMLDEDAPQILLDAGTIIQIAPLSPQLGIPWEVAYERPCQSYDEGETKLCDRFAAHGPAPSDCPYHEDPKVVCPWGFWGFRHIVEQIPCRVPAHQPPPRQSLPLLIRNSKPLRMSAVVFTGFNLVREHFAAIRGLLPQQIEVKELTVADDVAQALKRDTADIVYFYAHGGFEAEGTPYLKFGVDERITLIDLDAWRTTLRSKHALVMLNACESAGYSPDAFESLLSFFHQRGASGVIAAQCDLRELLAATFGLGFFQEFLRGESAGQALRTTRLSLLERLDPRGLAYSLFASADLKIAEPILP
jgi:hypothetical protein